MVKECFELSGIINVTRVVFDYIEGLSESDIRSLYHSKEHLDFIQSVQSQFKSAKIVNNACNTAIDALLAVIIRLEEISRMNAHQSLIDGLRSLRRGVSTFRNVLF